MTKDVVKGKIKDGDKVYADEEIELKSGDGIDEGRKGEVLYVHNEEERAEVLFDAEELPDGHHVWVSVPFDKLRFNEEEE